MRSVRAVVGLLAVVILASGSVIGQDPKPQGRAKGQLPPNWGKLGLSDDQKQQVYKIQTEYRGKIQDLQAQIKELQRQQNLALQKVLTDPQKARLRELATSKFGDAGESPPPKGKNKQP
jgi:hypothetical protein